MPEQTLDAAVSSAATRQSDNTCAATEERLPFRERAGAGGIRRCRREAIVRGMGSGLDETATGGFFFSLFVYGVRFILTALGLYGRGMRNTRKLRVVYRDVHLADLPEDLDGFRILHISDFHFPKRFPSFSEAIATLLDGVEVDLCVLTGDYRYGYFGPVDHVPVQMRTALRGLKSRHGVYAALGNHDHFVLGELLEEVGVTVLYNEGVALRESGCTLWLAGIDDPHFYQCDDLDAALRERPDDLFTILLAHSPERVAQAAEKGVDLYLAGHTHGGQIRFPLVGALVANAQCTRDQIWGAWKYKGMAGHTTAGIGSSDVPVRYNCPPETVVLTLHRGEAGA